MDIKSRLYGYESPKYSGTLMNKGNSLEDMNKLDEAIHAHNECLKILTKDESTNQIINIHVRITFVEFN